MRKYRNRLLIVYGLAQTGGRALTDPKNALNGRQALMVAKEKDYFGYPALRSTASSKTANKSWDRYKWDQ